MNEMEKKKKTIRYKYKQVNEKKGNEVGALKPLTPPKPCGKKRQKT